MHRTRAVVGTEHASRYLQQLCRHWAHRFPTEFSADAGRIALPLGETRLGADDDAVKLSGLRDVVVRHVERFAFRESLRFEWTAP
jgi:hypothetical protein